MIAFELNSSVFTSPSWVIRHDMIHGFLLSGDMSNRDGTLENNDHFPSGKKMLGQ
jgi:hypothetical protein